LIRTAAIFLRLWHFLLAGIAGGWLPTVANGLNYDGLLRPTGQSYLVATGNNTATADSYDARGRLLLTTTSKYPSSGPAVVVSSFDYSHSPIGRSLPSGYDRVGNVLQVEETYGPIPSSGAQSLRTVINSCDYAYRLTTERRIDGADTTTSYSYDRANNRTSRTVQVDGNPAEKVYWAVANPTVGYNTNQLYGISVANLGGAPLPSGTANYKTIYTYDKDGNRATRTTNPGTSGAQVDTYAYDQRNRLKSVTTTVAGATTATSTYTYDERTRRTSTVEASGTRRLSFSGGNYVQEYPATLNTQPSSEIVRGSDMGGGVGGILYTKTTSSGAVFSNFNSRGDVVSQTNASGGVDFEAKYDAFGKHLDSGVATGRQRANSKDEDPTGLLNEGMRYRDLEAGIFLTRDPAGLVDGPNVYTYVRQNPWTKWDPTGLFGVGDVTFSFQNIKDNWNSFAKGCENFKKDVEREAGWTLSFQNGVDKMNAVKSDPVKFGKDLAAGTLHPDSAPNSLGGNAGEVIGNGLAVLALLDGGFGGCPGGEAPMMAGSNGQIFALEGGILKVPTIPTLFSSNSASEPNPEGSTAKDTAEAPEGKTPQQRGRDNETRVLNDIGENKNTDKFPTSEGDAIPDYQNDRQIGEIKDTKSVYNTKQIRAQREAARQSNREHVIQTGEGTKVSKPVSERSTVVRRPDIGPQVNPEPTVDSDSDSSNE
jgi:RHS repeat-associated protein